MNEINEISDMGYGIVLESVSGLVEDFDKRNHNYPYSYGKQGLVTSFRLIDDSSKIRVVLWNGHARKYRDKINKGDNIILKNFKTSYNKFYKDIELKTDTNSEIINLSSDPNILTPLDSQESELEPKTEDKKEIEISTSSIGKIKKFYFKL